MIKFEHTEVFGFEGAIRGMRNPLNSWDKSDSFYCDITTTTHNDCVNRCPHYSIETFETCGIPDGFIIGKNDLKLAQNLAKAGTDHGKFLRQIMVSVDITSWATWWAEFDTYKVGTVRNSCSKMHKIHVKEFTKADFTTDGIDALDNLAITDVFDLILQTLNYLRDRFNETKDTRYWRALLELLPHGYNMKATVTLNYAVLRNIYHSRRNHKLDEWSIGFMNWIDTLPYAEELIKC